MAKPILVSGIQPTGRLHVGNYLGALKHFVELQNSGKYQCYFFIADLHALTENPAADDLAVNIKMLAADYLAAGLDPKKSRIYQQSQIPAHAELAWILNTITPIGELNRMTQFKEKGEKITTTEQEIIERDGTKVEKRHTHTKDTTQLINAGLFDYPVLQAADVLLYDAGFVPVGKDQLQHIELMRTLARKFNAKFGKTFIEPKALMTQTPRVMSLENPEKKMSKSSPAGCLFMDDSPEEIKAKVSRAVTDSGSDIKHGPHKPGVSNLLEIYAGLSGEPIAKIEKRFEGRGYGEFKRSLTELVADQFADFRKKKKALLAKPSTLLATLKAGSAQAAKVANQKIVEVKEKIGLTA